MPIRRIFFPAAVALAALTACDDGAVSDVRFDDVKGALAGDMDAFDAAKGKRVVWQGRVVEARKVAGDDYVMTGLLLVDLDEPDTAQPTADLSTDISVDDVAKFTAGQAVTLTGKIREIEVDGSARRIRLESESVE